MNHQARAYTKTLPSSSFDTRNSSSRYTVSRYTSGAAPPATRCITSSTGTLVPFRKLSAGTTLASSCRTVVVSTVTAMRTPSTGEARQAVMTEPEAQGAHKNTAGGRAKSATGENGTMN